MSTRKRTDLRQIETDARVASRRGKSNQARSLLVDAWTQSKSPSDRESLGVLAADLQVDASAGDVRVSDPEAGIYHQFSLAPAPSQVPIQGWTMATEFADDRFHRRAALAGSVLVGVAQSTVVGGRFVRVVATNLQNGEQLWSFERRNIVRAASPVWIDVEDGERQMVIGYVEQTQTSDRGKIEFYEPTSGALVHVESFPLPDADFIEPKPTMLRVGAQWIWPIHTVSEYGRGTLSVSIDVHTGQVELSEVDYDTPSSLGFDPHLQPALKEILGATPHFTGETPAFHSDGCTLFTGELSEGSKVLIRHKNQELEHVFGLSTANLLALTPKNDAILAVGASSLRKAAREASQRSVPSRFDDLPIASLTTDQTAVLRWDKSGLHWLGAAALNSQSLRGYVGGDTLVVSDGRAIVGMRVLGGMTWGIRSNTSFSLGPIPLPSGRGFVIGTRNLIRSFSDDLQ